MPQTDPPAAAPAGAPEPAPEPSVLVRRVGGVGHATLNRPAALNALTLEMVQVLDAALARWADDDAVEAVVVDGAGRGLCAGGDMRAVRTATLAGDPLPGDFWRAEYRLDARIARYPKPMVTVMDGITMGGGVGIGGHAATRVVTERSVVSMPEVRIGFAPDVGGAWLLARSPGELGTFAALTAARLGAADAILCGLADHHLPSASLDGLVDALRARPGHAREVVADLATEAPPGSLGEARPWIDACFATGSVAEVAARLAARSEPGAAAAGAELALGSPFAIAVTLRALRRARDLPSLEACLEQDLRVSLAFLDEPDLVEGIRAVLVDKDQARWSPATPDEVDDAAVEAFFAPRAGTDLFAKA